MYDIENFLGNDSGKIPGFLFVRERKSGDEIRYVYLSKNAKEQYGIGEYSPLSDILSLLHSSDKERFLENISTSEEKLTPYKDVFRITGRDGKLHWLSESVNIQKKPDGVISWSGMVIDITVDKQNEEWLSTTLNNAPEGIVTFGEDCVIISTNATMSQLFGYNEKELIGKQITDLMNAEQAPYFLEYISNYSVIVDVCGSQKLKNYECIRKDGSVFPVEFSMNDIKNAGTPLFVLTVRDITSRKQMEQALKDNEIKLANIVSTLPCAFFTSVIKPDGSQESIYLSDGADKFVGVIENTINNANTKDEAFFSMISEEDATEIKDFRRRLFEKNSTDFWEKEFKFKDGRWIQCSVKPEYMDNGKILNHGLIVDVTKRKHAEEKIRYMAYHDMMTRTGNRSFLMREFPKFIKSAKAKGNKFAVISIVPVNVSEFYADSGYDIGDMIMAKVAAKIKSLVDANDILSYVSGSRFVLLKGNINSITEVTELCNCIRNDFDKAIIVDKQEFDVSIKLGVSIYPDHSVDAKTLMKYSEAALMFTKRDFDDEYLFFTEEMKAGIADKLLIRNKLKYAIQNRMIVPFFQAQVSVSSGEIVGMEVLARWIDEDGNVIPPYKFIPVAEEFGLIEPMTELVVEEACRVNKKWIDEGIARVPIAVNISGKHHPANMLKMIKRMLGDIKIPGECLEVELTESSVMANPDETRNSILELLEMGVTSSIDDFGTGYSSLSMLKSFPFKKIKIDRSFVLDLDNDDGYAIVNATIAMGKALNLKILAEGVDNKKHFNILKKQGCEIIQGYLFSKPVPASEMEKKLCTWKAEHEILAVTED